MKTFITQATNGAARAAALFAGIALISSSAQAINYDATSNGMNAPAGSTFTAVGGSLGLKTVAGYTGLGVTDGYSGNEIDIGQSLTINFATPQSIDYLTIAFLYDGPEFGDPREKASISADGIPFYLRATGATSATWTGNGGNGAVANISPATSGGGGVWKITNPFTDQSILSITLTPVERIAGYGQDSDFSLLGFSTHDPLGFSTQSARVPDAGTTLGLIGMALLGLPLLRRRIQA